MPTRPRARQRKIDQITCLSVVCKKTGLFRSEIEPSLPAGPIRLNQCQLRARPASRNKKNKAQKHDQSILSIQHGGNISARRSLDRVAGRIVARQC